MDDPSLPPWTPSSEETLVSNLLEGFTSFDGMLQALAAQLNGNVTERNYYVSKEWGKVLRAKINLPKGSATCLVNCWYLPNSEMAFATKMEDDWRSTESGD